jgi:hypothetical protein
MVSIGDFEKIWKWAQVKWWRFPIAVFAVVLMLVLAYLNMFIKTEERLQVLTSCYSQLVSWFGMQEIWIIYYLPLIAAAIFTAMTLSVIILIIYYCIRKTLKDRATKIDNLNRAYVRMRYAYKKAAGITTRNTSFGMDLSLVSEDSREHRQQQSHNTLYIEAEKLAQHAGVPDDT